MEILWLAIVIYSIGLGVLLHFRPAFMFHENGSWKEFGYQRDSRHTLFPFWLFAIAWAFVSYVLAASIVWSFFTPIAVAASSYVSMNRQEQANSDNFMSPASNMKDEEYEQEYDQNYEDENEDDESEIKDVRIKNRNIHYEDGAAKPSARPGYYVIDPSSKNSGIRRYIYYGPTPPTD
jgi:hypothetical protein